MNANLARILIALAISTLFLISIFLMNLFIRYLRFKIKRKSKRVLDDDSECGVDLGKNPNFRCNETSSVVKKFGWEEIEKITMNFSRVIDEGGFSTVYLGHLLDSTLGAIKINRNSERLNRVFKQELEILLQIRHENIVKFLGYCDDREEGALVFEYVPNGTLHEKLHHPQYVLPWKNRILIAFQLAEAIEYLHESCNLQIVHGDVKATNLLLDNNLNCKLCDFGFAKMGFSSTVVPMSSSTMSPLMGSPGYIDPHYLMTGIPSKKNDVYSFGVMVLELITGIEAFSSEKEQLLTSIVGPILEDPKKVSEMVDPRLEADFNAQEAIVMASISARCLLQQPSLRPSMGDISRNMKEDISFVVDGSKHDS